MSKNNHNKLLNCSLDFQRAACSYCTNPRGKTHLVFLKHGLEILKTIKNGRAKKLFSEGVKIEKTLLKNGQKRNIGLADKLLTFGLMMKPV